MLIRRVVSNDMLPAEYESNLIIKMNHVGNNINSQNIIKTDYSLENFPTR